MRDSIIFYRSFFEAIKELPANVQAKVYNAIFEYSLNFNEVVLEGLPKTIFTLIKPQLEANNKKFENGKKGAEFGKLGGRKRTPKEPLKNPKETPNVECIMYNVNDNVECIMTNVNDNVNNILLEKESKIKIFDFRKKLIDFGFSEKLTDDWLKVRKTKKATNTETAFNKFIAEVQKANKDPNEILEICISKDWKGFQAEWLNNIQTQNFQNGKQQFTTPVKKAYEFSVDRVIETYTGDSK